MQHDIGEWMRRQTEEERKALASKAGKVSQAKQRRHRAMREVLKELMVLDTTDDRMKDLLTQLGLEPTNDNAVSLAQIINAVKGETEAARFVRDTLGEKPTENYNLGVSGKPIKALDLSKMSDEELEALADQTDAG
jgi:hypothetical protein